MSCSCVHNREAIERGLSDIAKLRKLFITRMTVDSETDDRRRRDYNQAIFHYEDADYVDSWNEMVDQYPERKWAKKHYGSTYPVWSNIDMDMVLRCFDDAVKDWRRTFCDVENCRRK